MSFRRGFAWVVALAVGIGLPGNLQAAGKGPWRVVDGETLRWEGIHRQQTSKTCGPASLVTLMTFYLGRPIDEEEAARRALGLTPEEVTPEALQRPATMRGLREALAGWHVEAHGLEMTLAGVQAYIADVGLPLIVRITEPSPHFTLVAGVAAGHVVTADSALGWRALAEDDFLALWDGVALAVHPRYGPGFHGREGAARGVAVREAARDVTARVRHLRSGMVGR